MSVLNLMQMRCSDMTSLEVLETLTLLFEPSQLAILLYEEYFQDIYLKKRIL